jgi:hypothetical protein
VRKQDAADGYASQKRRDDRQNDCAAASWKTWPTHLLVQKFPVVRVHLKSPLRRAQTLTRVLMAHAPQTKLNLTWNIVPPMDTGAAN